MCTMPDISLPQPGLLPDFHTDPRGFLRGLFDVAVRSAQPLHGMRAWLPAPPRGRTLVLGGGKAGGAMAQALEALWPHDARAVGPGGHPLRARSTSARGPGAAHRGGSKPRTLCPTPPAKPPQSACWR